MGWPEDKAASVAGAAKDKLAQAEDLFWELVVFLMSQVLLIIKEHGI